MSETELYDKVVTHHDFKQQIKEAKEVVTTANR